MNSYKYKDDVKQ